MDPAPRPQLESAVLLATLQGGLSSSMLARQKNFRVQGCILFLPFLFCGLRDEGWGVKLLAAL